MSIAFVDDAKVDEIIAIQCPRCRGTLRIPYKERSRSQEICPNCAIRLHVQIYTSGMVVLD